MTEWPATRLGCRLRIKHGFAFEGKHFGDRGDHIVLTPGNFVEAGGFKDKAGAEKYYTATPPKEYVLQRGDLVVAMTEQAQGLLGSSAMIPVDDRYLHNQRIGLVEPTSDDVELRFLYYLFNTPAVRDQIQATATGTKVRHTAPKRIEDVVVRLPPLPTQRKIAQFLSAYDDLIENNNRRIKILKEMARRIYREWFVNFRFPGHEAVPLVESEMGLIPAGWEVRSFESLGAYINGFAFKPTDWGSVGHPIIKIRELKNGVSVETPRFAGALSAKYVISDGDILFSWSADLDAYLWNGGTAWLNQHLFRVEPCADIPTLFLFHALQERMEEFRRLSQGTTMRHIKRVALSQVTSVVPTPVVRHEFAELAASIDGLALALVRASRNASEARNLLLPRLVSGEIDVAGLDIAMREITA